MWTAGGGRPPLLPKFLFGAPSLPADGRGWSVLVSSPRPGGGGVSTAASSFVWAGLRGVLVVSITKRFKNTDNLPEG